LAVAWAQSSTLSVGGAVRFLSAEGALGGTATLDLGAQWAPSRYFAIGAVIRDPLGPAGLVGSDADLPASLELGGQFRPFGNDAVGLELVAAVDTDGRLALRGLATVQVPRVGRLWGVLAGEDVRLGGDWQALVGAEIQLDRATVGGGTLFGSGTDRGWFVGARLAQAHDPEGLPIGQWVDDLEIRSAGARGTLGLLARLDQDRFDRRVRGVLLRLRSTGVGLAHAQEIRQAIGALRAAGKPVVCHLDAATGAELYICGAANQTYMDPAGYARLLGPSLTVQLYGDALRRLGVRTDFVRIGDFKSAVESYTNGRMSGPARQVREALLDDIATRLHTDMASDHEVSVADMQRWFDEGPYATEEAIALGLAESALDDHDLGDPLESLIGTNRRRTDRPRDEVHSVGRPKRIGVVVIDGTIVDGNNVDYPVLEIHQSGGRTIVAAIDQLAADSSIGAIVIRVDSPGGSALASDAIWRAIRRARKRKPVIASMGSLAASGGYYVAAAANEIWAAPSTITGSIGIFFGKADFAPLAEELGVTTEQLQRGRHAGATSLFRPFTGEERAQLADLIRRWYVLFLDRVAEARGMTRTEVDAVARGRVWTGDAAHARGLVDHLGGFAAALDRARELANVPMDTPAAFVPSRPSSLADYVTDALGLPRSAIDAAPARSSRPALGPGAHRALDFAFALRHTRVGIPLAMLPGPVALDD
jgi:protease-4